MVKGHRIERKIKTSEFLEIIKNYPKENIVCTKHTFFRLNEEQRKIFKCDDVIDYLLDKVPKLVGIQYNRCFTVFYKYKKKEFIKIILNMGLVKIEIVTFYMIDQNQLPRFKKWKEK